MLQLCSYCREPKHALPSAVELYYEPWIPLVLKTSQSTEVAKGILYNITGESIPGFPCERIHIHFIMESKPHNFAWIIKQKPILKVFICTSKFPNSWGYELITKPGQGVLKTVRFSIQLRVTEDAYIMKVNGVRFAERMQRDPFILHGDCERTTAIVVVNGDCEQLNVYRGEVDHYPLYVPPLTSGGSISRIKCRAATPGGFVGLGGFNGDKDGQQNYLRCGSLYAWSILLLVLLVGEKQFRLVDKAKYLGSYLFRKCSR